MLFLTTMILEIDYPFLLKCVLGLIGVAMPSARWMIETIEGNLSQGMRQLNVVYTQQSNRIHGLFCYLFQSRYRAILVEKEAYLLELSRYVVLNPIRLRPNANF